jgi:hypothetical protein
VKHRMFALVLGSILMAAAATGLVAGPAPAGSVGKVVWAGVRSSQYGIKPFPAAEGWLKAMKTMEGYFPGSSPAAIWIVGQMTKDRTNMHLFFPSDGKQVPHVEFEATDNHEAYLSAFDKAGIKVFLQVESADADMGTLIDLVLGRYKHHPCVIGFGADVEWFRVAEKPGTGTPIDDATAKSWEARVKSHNPGYRLFLKHWDVKWMPPTYRGDIVFVDDSQIFKTMDEMVNEFQTSWAAAFYPNTVVFQIGYGPDKPWWSKLTVPPQELGAAIAKGVRQDLGIIWVDFSLRDVLPLE